MKKASTGTCNYDCVDGVWVNSGGNPAPGYYCVSDYGACDAGSDITMVAPAQPIPTASSGLPTNVGEYFYSPQSKLLHFRGGSCDKGKVFKGTYSVKELAEVDEKAAELVKLIQKNKKFHTFTVLLKASKPSKPRK